MQKHFSHLEEETLLHILESLKEKGLLYYNQSLETIISIVRAEKRVKGTKTSTNDLMV
jgi:hypothetical protein